MNKKINIALVGCPNVGKTSLFNLLTQSAERVGNYPGVTVGIKRRAITVDGHGIVFSDLPGLYSLSAYSADEEVARDEILGGKYDVFLCVCDATKPERSLALCCQIIEAGKKVVIAMNMTMLARKNGINVSTKDISSRFGVPVLTMDARDKKNTHNALLDLIKFEGSLSPAVLPYFSDSKVVEIKNKLPLRDECNRTFAALKILERDEYVLKIYKENTSYVGNALNNLDGMVYVKELRSRFISRVISTSVTRNKRKKINITSVVDGILLNRYLALPCFFLIVACVFFLSFSPFTELLSGFLSRAIDVAVVSPISMLLTESEAGKIASGLVLNGIIGSLSAVVTFLPQITMLFFALSMLEESGYISRLAFMTDGLFEKVGLSGRAVFTMLMGFGCSAGAVMTARGLEEENMRKKAVLVTPFLPCTARVPVFTSIAAAYFFDGAWAIVLLAYVLSVVVAIVTSWALNRFSTKLRTDEKAFFMEMPEYRLLSFRHAIAAVLSGARNFLTKIGGVVFLSGVLIYLLSSFSFRFEYVSGENSVLASISGIVSPVFSPLGFGSWRAVAALLSGFIAKETVISTIEGLGGMSAVFVGSDAGVDALCFIVFVLLYVPCVATIGTMREEIGGKLTAFGVALQLIVAYCTSGLIRLICLFPVVVSSIAITVLVTVAVISVVANKRMCFCGCGNCGSCTKNRAAGNKTNISS